MLQLEKQDTAVGHVLGEMKLGRSHRWHGHSKGDTPWDANGCKDDWSILRRAISRIIDSQSFERIMGLVIVINIVLIVLETDMDATCFPKWSSSFESCPTSAQKVEWLVITNLFLLICYTLELFFRVYVWRVQFPMNRWNLLDLVVVVCGWAGYVPATTFSLNFLRIFRLSRLLRAARLVISVPELYLLMNGLMSSLRAIFFGTFILLSMIILWSILVVQFVHPVNTKIQYGEACPRCHRGFNSVAATSITLFQQIVTGDSWGEISVPVMEEAWWTGPFLIIIVITVSLGVMNLILAVIVERATEARENDVQRRLRQHEKDRHDQMFRLAKMCVEIDQNRDGHLTMEELARAYHMYPPFRDMLQVMDIRNLEELRGIFMLLDVDRSGDLSSKEFCEQLYDLKSRDMRMMMLQMKVDVLKLSVDQEVKLEQQKRLLMRHSDLLESIDRRLGGVTQSAKTPRFSVGEDEQSSRVGDRSQSPSSDYGLTRGNTAGGASQTTASDMLEGPIQQQSYPMLSAPGARIPATAKSWSMLDVGPAQSATPKQAREHSPGREATRILSRVAPPQAVEEIGRELRGLRNSIDEVGIFNDGVLSTVREQVAGLLHQLVLRPEAPTGRRQAVGSSAPQDFVARASPVAAPRTPTEQQLDRVGEQVRDLRAMMRQRLLSVLRGIEEKMAEETRALSRCVELVDDLGGVVGLPQGTSVGRRSEQRSFAAQETPKGSLPSTPGVATEWAAAPSPGRGASNGLARSLPPAPVVGLGPRRFGGVGLGARLPSPGR